MASLSEVSFPCTRYQHDIIGFAEEILGFVACYTLEQLVAIRDDEDARGVPEDERAKCLWPKQVEILVAIQNAVADPVSKRVAVSSGHKISKSHTAAIAGLWFYSSFSDAKVIFSSTTFHQVQSILWDEFRKVRHRSRVVIPGDMHLLASSGFLSEDFRQARGFTAREPEAVAGISGKNLLFILDEASGIPDAIHEAVAGNMAGSATLVMFSNPTRTIGTFFEAFNEKADFYNTFQISSEETPNAVTGRRLIPGLATRAFCEEMAAEWGRDSAFYKIRVLGQFVLLDEAKPFSAARVLEAENRWHLDPRDAPVVGRLHIGVDPAGPGDGGDETGFAVRRGHRVLRVYARLGLSEDGILAEVEGLINEHSTPNEIAETTMPIVAVDREGPIGYGVWLKLRKRAEENTRRPIRVVGVRGSDKAQRRPDLYDRLRDELWGNLEAFIKDGGAIPTDAKLEKELYTIEWSQTLQGRLKATPKDVIRSALGRSPDRADALGLAVWEPSGAREVDDQRSPRPEAARQKPHGVDPYTAHAAFDPYAGM